jgi:hypothetical protein
MKTRVRLFVTGTCEREALHASLRSVFADQPVEFEREFSPEWGFTSTRVPTYLPGEKSRAARLAAALVADVDPALSDREVPDLLIAIDDLELCNVDQAQHVVAYFRSAVHEHLGQRRWSASDRTRAVERVRERCSLHLLKPMVEAYFFGDRAALARAGAMRPSLFDPIANDVESFAVSDAGYRDCAAFDCASRTLDKAMHPKRYLRHLTDHVYKETRGGADALAALAWGGVLDNHEHARFARSLIADIAEKLDVPNPCAGGCAPETELKPRGLLRNA